jgi:trehalose 6-phosphate synthase
VSERLIVVSNRLPFAFRQDAEGAWHAEPGGGGLVTALLPVLRDRGGMWIGWPGITGDAGALDGALNAAGANAGYTLHGVSLSAEEMERFYLGFSNEIIWPLFHDLQSLCNFDPAYWRTYCEVNGKYADVVKSLTAPGDFIWIHDYHLMNVAAELRRNPSRLLGTRNAHPISRRGEPVYPVRGGFLPRDGGTAGRFRFHSGISEPHEPTD